MLGFLVNEKSIRKELENVAAYRASKLRDLFGA
jgi:hypothetical protein